MILDTSVLVAVLYGEPESDRYIRLIHAAERCLISAGSFLELSIVIERQTGPEVARQCDMFFRRAGIIIEPFHRRAGAYRTPGVSRFRKRAPQGWVKFRRLLRLCTRQ